MGFTVYFSNVDKTSEAGFGKVAHLPCIYDARPGYHRLGSRYLIDRGLGVWDPVSLGKHPKPSLTDQTILNYANWLSNFLEWADTRGINLITCEYTTHIHGRYQAEMLQGVWSRDGAPLSPQTINSRVQQACDFLLWMACKGHREDFDVPTTIITVRTGGAKSSISHERMEVATRQGKVRANKRRLRMPNDSELREWLSRVYQKAGKVKGLMCETILLTAMRREEIGCLRVNLLPEHPNDWHLSDANVPRAEQRVLVDIKFGVKGSCYGRDHGDKVGPQRSIWIPLDLAERLHEYRNTTRLRSLKTYVAAADTIREKRERIANSVHLFLDEKSGERLTGKALYNAWTSVELPYKGWTPHLGRDWWACSVLWREIKKNEKLRSLGSNQSAALIESSAMDVIRLQIQPQLGHADDKTTLVYLQWVADMISISPSIQFKEAAEV